MSSTNQGATAPTPDQLVVYEAWLRAIANGTCDFDPEALTESSEAIGALRTRVFNLEAQVKTLTEAHDEITMIVGYIVTHGIADEPSPSPEDGGPQVVHVTWRELGELIHRIGDTARTALKEAGADE